MSASTGLAPNDFDFMLGRAGSKATVGRLRKSDVIHREQDDKRDTCVQLDATVWPRWARQRRA